MTPFEKDEPLLSIVEHYWWLMAFRGLIVLVFGVLIFLKPEITTLFFVTLFAVYMVLNGLFSLFLGIRARTGNWRISTFFMPGILSLFAGLVIYVAPGLAAIALVGMVGLWSVIIGLIELLLYTELRKVLLHRWALLLAGLLSGFAGAALLLRPFYIVMLDEWPVGETAIVLGAALMFLAFRLRHVRDLSPSKVGSGSAA